MARISAETRQGKLDELEFNMRKCFMSASTIEVCRENATAQTIDFLCDLFRGEREKREKSRVASLVKAAGFPTIKNIDDYCTSEIRLPSSITMEKLKSLDFIRDKHTLIMHGICGSGKTMLAICLGMLACRSFMKVKFYTLSQLSERLMDASDSGRLEAFLATLRQLDLLIIDEWGYTSFSSESANLIYRVIADSYEQKSLIITTNLAFSEWGKLFSDDQLAAAIIDRIVHYGYPIDCGDKDWRLSNSPMKDMEFRKVAR